MFRPVDSETIAEIVSRIEEEKLRLSQLSASSVASAAGDDTDIQSLGDGGLSCEPQPMMVDESGELVTSDPVQCTPGLSLLFISFLPRDAL